MASIKGTRTEQNLLKAFAGESQARNRYTYFASVAKKEGYEQISAIFLETADNEKEHAKVFFKYLEGGDVEITATYPAGKIGTTAENLAAAAAGEKRSGASSTPTSPTRPPRRASPRSPSRSARSPRSRRTTRTRYRKLLANVDDGKVFKRRLPDKWKCRNCGYVHEGAEAPELCPACKHPQAYYELLVEAY